LIQRDYSNVSLYDYYFDRPNDNDTSNREVKLTDSGRTVYGGGGIKPDVKIDPPKDNKFEDTLLQHYTFFNFAKHYVVTHHPTEKFEVDDAVMQEFRKSLDEDKTPYTEADLVQNNEWVRNNIKSEIFVDAFGQEKGLQVKAEGDPEVTKALELLPQAQKLAENAKKIVAERSTPNSLNR
jgi:carboxyl-terminal processing protease